MLTTDMVYGQWIFWPFTVTVLAVALFLGRKMEDLWGGGEEMWDARRGGRRDGKEGVGVRWRRGDGVRSSMEGRDSGDIQAILADNPRLFSRPPPPSSPWYPALAPVSR